MIKCTESEKTIIKTIHHAQIWGNIIYVIPSIVALYNKMWIIGIFGLIVSIVSALHHKYIYVHPDCVVEHKSHEHYTDLTHLDVILSNLLTLYMAYRIYKSNHKKTISFLLSLFIIGIIGLVFFYLSGWVYDSKAEKEDINSQAYLKNSTLYDFYHGMWHTYSGIIFIIGIIYLSQ